MSIWIPCCLCCCCCCYCLVHDGTSWRWLHSNNQPAPALNIKHSPNTESNLASLSDRWTAAAAIHASQRTEMMQLFCLQYMVVMIVYYTRRVQCTNWFYLHSRVRSAWYVLCIRRSSDQLTRQNPYPNKHIFPQHWVLFTQHCQNLWAERTTEQTNVGKITMFNSSDDVGWHVRTPLSHHVFVTFNNCVIR